MQKLKKFFSILLIVVVIFIPTIIHAENIDRECFEMPYYFQADYPDVPYGNYGTVESHGCGPTSLAMVGSLCIGKFIYPDEVAKQYGAYNYPNGSSWELMTKFAEDHGFSVRDSYDIKEVKEALRQGDVAISSQKAGLFTNGGHYIVLSGLTDDGKIMVHDPNKWSLTKLEKEFKYGFEDWQIAKSNKKFWIYDVPKFEEPKTDVEEIVESCKELKSKLMNVSKFQR